MISTVASLLVDRRAQQQRAKENSPAPAETQPKIEECCDQRDVVKRRRYALHQIPAEDGDLAMAYRYWDSLRQDGLLPARRDIDIVKLRPLASKLHLVDVYGDDQPRFRFRLYGSGIPLDGFRNYTSLEIEDYPSQAYSRSLIEDYSAVSFTGVPCYQHVVARIDFIGHSYSRLIAPLADDGRRVNALMVCIRLRGFDDLTV